MDKDRFLKPSIKNVTLKQCCKIQLFVLGLSQIRNETISDLNLWNLVFPHRVLPSSPWALNWSWTLHYQVLRAGDFYEVQSLTHVFFSSFQEEWPKFQIWYHPALSAVRHWGRNVHIEQGIEAIIFKTHPDAWYLSSINDSVLSGQYLPKYISLAQGISPEMIIHFSFTYWILYRPAVLKSTP